MTRLRDMTQDQLIAWFSTLPFSVANRNKIIKGIKQYATEFDDPVTGADFFYVEDVADIQELTAGAIDIKLARSLLVEINKKKDQDDGAAIAVNLNNKKSNNDNNNNDNGRFTLTLVAQQGGIVEINNVTKSWTVSQIKAEYLAEQGVKWMSNEDKTDLIKSGKVLQNDRTLEYYGITSQLDVLMPLIVLFKSVGGGLFEQRNKEWKIMFEACPVCVSKQRSFNNLTKGYWSHPGDNKAEFKSSKPSSTYAVETKMDKIRCGHCKKECDGKDWVYKCPNHDYQRINI